MSSQKVDRWQNGCHFPKPRSRMVASPGVGHLFALYKAVVATKADNAMRQMPDTGIRDPNI